MTTFIQKNRMVLIISALIAVFAASMIYANQAASKSNEGVEIFEHVKGNPAADVVVTKYGDFECPFCAAAAPVVDELVREFGDDVRFEYKHLPLIRIHPNALPAAVAAEAAGQQGKFYEFHDLLYQRQEQWSRGANPTAVYIQFAQELDLDTATFKRHLGSSLLRDKVQTEGRDALERGFSSTPTFTLNGERIPYAGLEQMQTLLRDTLGREAIETEDEINT